MELNLDKTSYLFLYLSISVAGPEFIGDWAPAPEDSVQGDSGGEQVDRRQGETFIVVLTLAVSY